MIIYVDIDETICNSLGDYKNAVPITKNIAEINRLYEEGHQIIYWTARGSVTGIDWSLITECQLQKWGCKYHELRLNKPYYDILVDDKALTRISDLCKTIKGIDNNVK